MYLSHEATGPPLASQECIHFNSKMIPKTSHTHGTGCTLSSAITALLAQGQPLTEAVERAKKYIADAIAHADHLHIGAGHGPVHHFYQ